MAVKGVFNSCDTSASICRLDVSDARSASSRAARSSRTPANAASSARRRPRTTASATATAIAVGTRTSVTAADADIDLIITSRPSRKSGPRSFHRPATLLQEPIESIGDNEFLMRRWRWPLLLAACFAFRLAFGLSREFFFEDDTQIFLLGFRYYATAAWPFFGPDVVWTRSEIPGALQALLVGLPLRVLAIPESPFVLLNLLSFAAICALAWYACAQLPQAPRWLIWGWFLTMPWTIEFSAHMINTSYILAPAVVFFIGFFEAAPAFSLRRLPPAAAFAMMGLAMIWLLQIHMSWPLLIPFAAGAWISRRSDGMRALAIDAAAFVAAALIPGALLLPTLARFGPQAGSGGVLRNLHPHWVNPWIIVTTLARF